MKTIPAKYFLNGWHYKLVTRNETAAIYSQSPHPDLPAWEKAVAYEVVLIRIHSPRHTGTFQFEGGEVLPKEDKWGDLGWTCGTLERAREKFAEVSTPERITAAKEKLASITP